MNQSNPLSLVPNVETQKSINDHINEVLRKKRGEREYLCAAFIEETKLKPSECILFEQTIDGVTKIWLEKKVPVNINPNDCNCDQALEYKRRIKEIRESLVDSSLSVEETFEKISKLTEGLE